MDLNALIPSGVNAILLTVAAWLFKRWMHDICERLTRLENTVILKKGG